jgi:hypothetical protein
MALVSVSELKTYMDMSFTNRQEDAAQFIIDGLQSELETYLRRPVEVATFTESQILESTHVGVPMSSFFYNEDYNATATTLTYAQPPTTIYLENSPVATITSVNIVHPTSNTAYLQVAGRDYMIRPYGVDVYTAYANDKVIVVYTAGLVGGNIKMFKHMILRAASREMQNLHDDVVGLKDLTTREVALKETGFLEKELMSVKRWRRNRIA